jgi:glutamyl-tRNA reductase
MNRNRPSDLDYFFAAGINYRKGDAEVRSLYAINPTQYGQLLLDAPSRGLHEIFVLSTCNRTEIYGFAEDPSVLTDLLCSYTAGGRPLFEELAYHKKGMEAVQHLFSVAAGLDSQILGDYEIVGQIKQSMKIAKERKLIGAFLDRILGSVLQASRVIKNQTALSDGTVSVSFAAIQYIKQYMENLSGKKVLLIGTGKIGRNTCRNLVDYLGAGDITLVNRTEEKAADLASTLGLKHAPIEDLDNQVRLADIIVVATNAPEPVLLKKHFEGLSDKLVLDLSIPFNAEKQIADLARIHLVDIDELSRMKDETLQKREAEIPKAKAIIEEHIGDLLEWFEMRKHVPVLKAVKSKLQQIHDQSLTELLSSPLPVRVTADPDLKIQRVLNGMATKMRKMNQRGCHYIEAINEFIAEEIN